MFNDDRQGPCHYKFLTAITFYLWSFNNAFNFAFTFTFKNYLISKIEKNKKIISYIKENTDSAKERRKELYEKNQQLEKLIKIFNE